MVFLYADKKSILEFKTLHPENMSYDWQTIRTKVLNERMAHSKRKKMRMDKMMP